MCVVRLSFLLLFLSASFSDCILFCVSSAYSSLYIIVLNLSVSLSGADCGFPDWKKVTMMTYIMLVPSPIYTCKFNSKPKGV
jgi:hypothetical protein